jgi:hypothetical protein
MADKPPRTPPYFDWQLDRWKLTVLLGLFLLLLLWALFAPIAPG